MAAKSEDAAEKGNLLCAHSPEKTGSRQSRGESEMW